MLDKIIDQRKRGKFLTDNEYIDRYAKFCGWKATIAYFSLCRHANHDGACFPGVKLMATQHKVARQTISQGLKQLAKWSIIKITKQENKGRWKNNDYILLDSTRWKRTPCY